MSSLQKAIDMVGLSGVGDLFDPKLSPQAVHKWIACGIPADRVIAVCRATEWQVTPHMLRPDIYPNPDDALPSSRKVWSEVVMPPTLECCSGDPRHGIDRRQPDQRMANRRKESV